jgi:hypothetical protein
MLTASLLAGVLAVSARWSFEDAYDNVDGGAWYIGQDNESANLAWGESYVMSGLAAMFRATGHPMYLERLVLHIDGVLAVRDDARGVADYRGVSGACWRNTSYQDGPYCYAVHTGMLVMPMLEFVAAIRAEPRFGDRLAADGQTLASKADAYLVAAQESVAFHDFEWDPAGFYVFADDASFLEYAGVDQPLNQSNALGRAHVLLAELAPGGPDLDRATALAQRMSSMITVAGDGAYLWNYWGGPVGGNGEDVSHAAINVDFAALCAAHGIVFDDADVRGLAATFMQRVYVDDGTFADHVGGGSTNDPSYRPQVGRWLALATAQPAIYTAVRDLYDADYPGASVGSGSLLVSWGLLAEHEPKVCAPYFYTEDWQDDGDVREATAYGANVLTIPPAVDGPCAVRVDVDTARTTTAAQWDGDVYHRSATWRASDGVVRRHIPYDPQWPFVYDGRGVLFQFEDAFVTGEGIRVTEPAAVVPITIDSEPDLAASIGAPWSYAPVATGDGARWWSLPEGPGDADVDPATGIVTWTPGEAGSYAFTLRVDDEYGRDEQSFVVELVGVGLDWNDAPGDGGADETTAGGATGSGGGSSGASAGTSGGSGGGVGATAGPAAGEGGCGCAAGSGGGWGSAALMLLALARRRAR